MVIVYDIEKFKQASKESSYCQYFQASEFIKNKSGLEIVLT